MLTKSPFYMNHMLFYARLYGRSQGAGLIRRMSTLTLGTNVKSYQIDEDWLKMNPNQRINHALNFDEPDSATIAFYKGIGCASLNLHTDAVNLFERAEEMDPKFSFLCELKVAEVYERVGNYKVAMKCLKNSCKEMFKLKPKDIEDLKLVIGEDVFAETTKDVMEESMDKVGKRAKPSSLS